MGCHHAYSRKGVPRVDQRRERSGPNEIADVPAFAAIPGPGPLAGRNKRTGSIRKEDFGASVLVHITEDVIPAIAIAKSEGVLVRLYHGGRPHSDLWQEADERTIISQTLIDSIRR